MEMRTVILLIGSVTILNMLTQAFAQSRYGGESYLDQYGPGSSSNTGRDRYENRPGPDRGGGSRHEGESYLDQYGPGSNSNTGRDRYENRPGPDRGGGSRHEGESYLEQYGPGSSSNTGRDRYENRPGPDSRRPSGGAGQSCPRTLREWEYDMEGCMTPLNRLSNQASMQQRCRAYREAEPCVDAMKTCKLNNPQIQYYKSKPLQTWMAMEREAEVYGVCHDNEGGGSRHDGGSRRPSGGAGQSCPRTLSEYEYDMEGCMRPLNRLSKTASMLYRCRAYRDAEPCVDAMKTCKLNNPQIQYYKSKSLETWTAMEREAEVYGVCHDIE